MILVYFSMCLLLLILYPRISNQSQVHVQYQVGFIANLSHLLLRINIEYLHLILALLCLMVNLHIQVVISLRQLLTKLDLICCNSKTIHVFQINLFDHSFGVQL